QPFAALDSGHGQKIGCRPAERVIHKTPDPRNGPSLNPSWIGEIAPLNGRFLDHLLQVRNSDCGCEFRFVELYLKAIFNGAHQIDTFERTEATERFCRPARNVRHEIRNRSSTASRR